MDRPKRVIVGPHRWKVEYVGSVKYDDCVGLCDAFSHTIQIVDGRPESAIRETLFHEVLHAVSYTFGLQPPSVDVDFEEALVCFYSPTVLEVLRHNRKLTDYLLG